MAATIAGAQVTPKKLPRTEILILVDLSDRIDPKLHPHQIARDTAILRLVAAEFGEVVRAHKFLFSRDLLRAEYLGGEGEPVEPRVDVARMNAMHQVVVTILPSALETFSRNAVQPEFAKRTKYVGADLWSWFKFSAPKQLSIVDENRITQRRVIILTDGYLQFSPTVRREPGTAMRMDVLRGRRDWQAIYPRYKLRSTGGHFVDTKVLILEAAPIRPEQFTAEEEIMERYWTDWFQSMGIPAEMFTSSEPLPTIADAIRNFLK